MSPNELERRIRTILSDETGLQFYEKPWMLQVGSKHDGSPRMHPFDIVSTPDKTKLVAEVKTGLQYDQAVRFREIMMDCYYLNKIHAEQKMMIMTNRLVYERFRKDSDGLIEDIEVRLIELQ